MNYYKDIPVAGPDWDDISWAIGFSTVSYSGGDTHNYRNDHKREELNKLIDIDTVEWLTLNHGDTILTIPPENTSTILSGESMPTPERLGETEFADAAIVVSEGYGAAITTADCLPVILLSPLSKAIAVVHAGWKGVVNGIVEKTVEKMSNLDGFALDDLRVWIGPSVRADYEIRDDVKSLLIESPNVSESHFVAINDAQYLVDLPGVLIEKLVSIGVMQSQIEVFPESTIKSERFFSVRREGAQTGRFATIVAIR